MLRLYLVRHGRTAWNETGRFQGHSDVPLDSVGVRQAQQAAHWLAECVRSPQGVYTSDLLRASQTAKPIAHALQVPLSLEPRLRERYWGDWEGLTLDEVRQRYHDQHLTYLYDPLNGTPPSAEPMSLFWERVSDFIHALFKTHADGEWVIVGHGGSLRIILCEVLGGDVQTYRRIRLDNASLSLIEHTGERVYVALLNSTFHLQDPSVDGF